MTIQYGLKLWSTNAGLLDQARDLVLDGTFQFIELMPIPGTSRRPFQDLDIPIVIHVTTDRFGVNIADPAKTESNRQAIALCAEWADATGAETLILHPGAGSLADALVFLDGIDDTRIIIENMPVVGLDGEHMVGYTAEQLRELMGTIRGFCLDLNHAVKAASSLREDLRGYLEGLLLLSPSLYHLSDGHALNEKDEHLALGTGDYDLAFLLSCAVGSRCGRVTLETPRTNQLSLAEDLDNLGVARKIVGT